MFSKNFNRIFYGIAGFAASGIVTAIFLYFYYYTPEYTATGYQPVQNLSFSHATHTGQLGIDCRYCHYSVEQSRYAGLPEASVCMNCHNQVLAQDERITAIKRAVAERKPIVYTRIHRLPDFVWFDHAVHVRRGVACVYCHGDVWNMERTYQAKSLGMKFCLECHRNPKNYLVPLSAVAKAGVSGNFSKSVEKWNVKPNINCSACHR